MTETTNPTFSDALQWVFTNGGILRFFEDADKERKRPSVRITIVSVLKPEEKRYVAVHHLQPGESIEDAFVVAALSAKEQFELGEAEIVAEREQASRPRLRLA